MSRSRVNKSPYRKLGRVFRGETVVGLRRLTTRVEHALTRQDLFDMMIAELTERSAYPDERTNQGAVNIREALAAGVIALVEDQPHNA